MDFSKFKFELYDILALVLPGFLFLCGLWVLLRGWHLFTVSFGTLSGTTFTALLLSSVAVGQLIQELGDAAIKKTCGRRYFKSGRDDFWKTEDGVNVSRLIADEVGFTPSVDTAFDFCLTKIKGAFPRRDVFIATSDFCRSLLVVGFLLIPPVCRLVWDLHGSCLRILSYAGGIVLCLALFLYLAGRRMRRFRELSESTVFGVYLAFAKAGAPRDSSVELAAGRDDDEDGE